MLPDFSEYNWVIPDFVWELSEQIDLGKCWRSVVKVLNSYSLSYCTWFFSLTEKLAKALPEMEEIAKLLPDLDKIQENFSFFKSLLSSGK